MQFSIVWVALALVLGFVLGWTLGHSVGRADGIAEHEEWCRRGGRCAK